MGTTEDIKELLRRIRSIEKELKEQKNLPTKELETTLIKIIELRYNNKNGDNTKYPEIERDTSSWKVMEKEFYDLVSQKGVSIKKIQWLTPRNYYHVLLVEYTKIDPLRCSSCNMILYEGRCFSCNIVICESCGEEIDPKVIYCSSCGGKV